MLRILLSYVMVASWQSVRERATCRRRRGEGTSSVLSKPYTQHVLRYYY